MSVEEDNNYCNSTFLDGLYNMISSVYSSFSKGSDETTINSYNTVIDDSEGISLHEAVIAPYDYNVMDYTKGTSLPKSLSEISVNNYNFSNENPNVLALKDLPYEERKKYNQKKRIHDLVEGREVSDPKEQAEIKKLIENALIGFLGDSYNVSKSKKSNNSNHESSIDAMSYSVSSSQSQSPFAPIDAEFYKPTVTEKTSQSLGKSPNSVNSFSFESSEKSKEKHALEKYFKGHHLYEASYLETVEHEDKPETRTNFWKERMNRIHEHEESQATKWGEKVKSEMEKSDSFVRFY